MIRSDFEAQGRKIAAAPIVGEQVLAGFNALRAALATPGQSFMSDGSGTLVHPVDGFLHYQGCLVEDAVFGPYVLRLELGLRWEEVTLGLAAYRCQPGPPSAVSRVEEPGFVYELLGSNSELLDCALHDAAERLRTWVVSEFNDSPSAVSAEAARFRQRLDRLLAP